MTHLLKGLIIGFALAAAVGPICLLCLRRSLTDGKLVGFISGLGVATADALYAGVAALGVTAITSALDHYHTGLQLAAGAILIGLGIHTYRTTPPSTEARPEHATSLHTAYFSTFLLTLANPATLLALTFILAAMGLTPGTDTLVSTSTLVLGVFLGSSVWWSLLSMGAGWFGQKLSARTLRAIAHIAGIAIIAFGLWEIVTLALAYFQHA
ncbi:MAG TPA: LysE family transporter [Rariglobus sp.]|nr:LysE family transporter [Rariglobus sp.]